jgi:acetyl esterase/lipase
MTDSGITIDPTLAALIDDQRRVVAAAGPGMPPPPDVAALLPATHEAVPGATPLKVRIIRPPGPVRGVLFYIHGGGFVQGTPAMGDAANSYYARSCGMLTVAVGYRLAPAHCHPAALDDCERALLWLLDGAARRLGSERVCVAGGSVGASLAVLTLLRLRDRHQLAQRIAAVSLEVGNYDFSGTPSQRSSTDALFLSPTRLREIVQAAFPGIGDDGLRDPSISTLYADLRALPPAIFSTGTRDAVVDDSLSMAARWRAAGNRAELHVYPEATHFFAAYPSLMAAESRRRIANFFQASV